MTRPADLPGTGWGTNPGRRTALSSAQWGTGWVEGQPLTAKDLNDPLGQLSDWIEYLQTSSPTDGVWTVINSGTTYGTLGYSTTSGTWLTLTSANGRSGLQIEAGSATAAHVVRQTMTPGASPTWTLAYDPAGADVIMLKVGSLGMIGPTAVASASTGIRYGYPGSSKQASAHYYDPCLGGFTPVRPTGVNGIGPVYECAGSPEYWNAANASAVSTFDVVFRHRLLLTSPTGQLSGYPVFTGLSATFSGTANDLTARIWSRNRSTGTDTAITGAITGSSPSVSVSTAATPATHDYFIELKAAGMTPSSVTSDGIRAIIVTMEWQSLVPTM